MVHPKIAQLATQHPKHNIVIAAIGPLVIVDVDDDEDANCLPKCI